MDERELTELRDAQTRRGHDDAGLWLSDDGRSGLGPRRLTIIDLSPPGHPPMSSADERHWIVCDGQIDDDRELRRELEERGEVVDAELHVQVGLGAAAAGRVGPPDVPVRAPQARRAEGTQSEPRSLASMHRRGSPTRPSPAADGARSPAGTPA